jgi:hypothetical protein
MCLPSALSDDGSGGLRSFEVIEACSLDLDLGIPLFRRTFNFRADIFALTITIRPNKEPTRIPTLRHNIIIYPLTPLLPLAPLIPLYLYLWHFLRQRRRLKQCRGLATMPLSPRIPEIHLCQVSRDTRKDDLAVAPFGEAGIELVVFYVLVAGVADVGTGTSCEDGRHGLCDRGLFGDAQDLHGWRALPVSITGWQSEGCRLGKGDAFRRSLPSG